MRGNTLTSIIYVLTAAVGSLFALSHNGAGWSDSTIIWLCFCVPTLLFVFAYPKFLLKEAISRTQQICEGLMHLIAVVSATILFSAYSPGWKNPLRNGLGESVPVLVISITLVVVFVVAAVSLLVKGRSQLATPAAILLWPYCFGLMLATEGHWYQDTGIYAAGHFLCFIAPIVLAFAAGATKSQPKIPHIFALLSLSGFLRPTGI